MIRRIAVFGLSGLVLVAVESALRAALGFEDFAFHLALGLVVWLGARTGLEGAIAAAIIGWVGDVFTGSPFGFSVTLAVAVYLFVRAVSPPLDLKSWPIVAALGLVSQLVWAVGAVLLMALRSGPYVDWSTAIGGLALQLVGAILFVPLVFRLAERIDRVAGGETPEGGEVWLP